jgi:methionine-R-sulfoxide reductase
MEVRSIGIFMVALVVAGCAYAGAQGQIRETAKGPERKDKVVLSDEEWRRRLTKEQFEILRGKGTEPAFCGVLEDFKGAGTYHCVGCDLELFRNDAKFESGTGWPSFFQPAVEQAVWYRADGTFHMRRTEVLCSRCDGHLGHVFPDGPRPSGLRYCINGTVLKFKPRLQSESGP